MKKQYTTPEVEILKVNSTGVICTSASFGDGTTDTMHAREQGDFSFDDEDNFLWNE